MLMNWSSLHVRKSVVPSYGICDLTAMFNGIVFISVLVSWNCGHSVRQFYDWDHLSEQIMTHIASSIRLTTILVNIRLSEVAFSIFQSLSGIIFKEYKSNSWRPFAGATSEGEMQDATISAFWQVRHVVRLLFLRLLLSSRYIKVKRRFRSSLLF